MESLICLEKKLDMGNTSNGFHNYGRQRFPESLCLSVMKLSESEETERIIPKKLTCGVGFQPEFNHTKLQRQQEMYSWGKGNGFRNELVFCCLAWPVLFLHLGSLFIQIFFFFLI